MSDFQCTIASSMEVVGVGLHSGNLVNMVIHPAVEDFGVVFKRSDVLSCDNLISAKYYNVHSTSFCTEISNSSGVKVATIEHLMAALWGAGIDNIIIEVDAPELPVMDGSSKCFVELLNNAGIYKQKKKRKIVKILNTVSISEDNASIVATKSKDFSIDFSIDFENKVIGKQSAKFGKSNVFKDEIAPARTFGFMKDIDNMNAQGLAKGASLDNTIGISDDRVINPGGLRCKDEFVKHKILDCIGDLFLSGYRIEGHFKSSRGGHKLNNLILKEIFSNPDSHQIM